MSRTILRANVKWLPSCVIDDRDRRKGSSVGYLEGTFLDLVSLFFLFFLVCLTITFKDIKH